MLLCMPTARLPCACSVGSRSEGAWLALYSSYPSHGQAPRMREILYSVRVTRMEIPESLAFLFLRCNESSKPGVSRIHAVHK